MRKRLDGGRLFLGAWLLGVLVFLYAPIAVLVLMSFNASSYGTLPFSPTLRWYAALFSEGEVWLAALRSLALGAATALGSTILGTLAAVGLTRYRFRGRAVLAAFVPFPVIVPWMILGIAILLLFSILGVQRSAASLLAGHLVTTLPYVIIVVSARLEGLDPAVEEAARSLGAGRWRTLAYVTAPLALPAIVAGALMAFMVSFDNFIISYFLSPPELTTLPMRIYQSIRLGYTPDMNAIATLILAASLVVVVAGERLLLRGTLVQGPVAGGR
ncbi:MAG: ABC transporter permease [Chloroflexota bacterium]